MLRAGFSADGNRLAVPAADGSIGIWDVGTGKVVQSLKPAAERRRPEEADCRYLLFSRDAKQLFAGTASGTIRRWDVESGKELAPLRAHRDAVRSLHLTRGGAQLVSTSADGMIRRWDVAAGTEIEPVDGYSGSLYARLSPKGESVLLLDAAGRMDIWDLSNGRLRTPIRPAGDASLDTPWVEPLFGFTPEGKRVFLAERNGKISIYDAGSGKSAGSIALAGYAGRAAALRFCISTPDGQAFVVNRGPGGLRLIRASNGEEIWQSPSVTTRGLCFPPVIAGDGKSILLGVTTLEDKPYTELRGKLELVRVDLSSGKVVARTALKSDSTGDVAFLDQPSLSSDGRTLVMSYGDTEVVLADPVAKKALHHYALFLHRPALSADGKQMIGVFLNEIDVFEVATAKKLFQLPIGAQTVQSLHLLPDGRHVFTSGNGGHACLWDLKAALPVADGQE
jgi:WD40 repeat protein